MWYEKICSRLSDSKVVTSVRAVLRSGGGRGWREKVSEFIEQYRQGRMWSSRQENLLFQYGCGFRELSQDEGNICLEIRKISAWLNVDWKYLIEICILKIQGIINIGR